MKQSPSYCVQCEQPSGECRCVSGDIPKRIKIDIALGDQAGEDIALALHDLARKIGAEYGKGKLRRRWGVIRDINGNHIGEWRVS